MLSKTSTNSSNSTNKIRYILRNCVAIFGRLKDKRNRFVAFLAFMGMTLVFIMYDTDWGSLLLLRVKENNGNSADHSSASNIFLSHYLPSSPFFRSTNLFLNVSSKLPKKSSTTTEEDKIRNDGQLNSFDAGSVIERHDIKNERIGTKNLNRNSINPLYPPEQLQPGFPEIMTAPLYDTEPGFDDLVNLAQKNKENTLTGNYSLPTSVSLNSIIKINITIDQILHELQTFFTPKSILSCQIDDNYSKLIQNNNNNVTKTLDDFDNNNYLNGGDKSLNSSTLITANTLKLLACLSHQRSSVDTTTSTTTTDVERSRLSQLALKLVANKFPLINLDNFNFRIDTEYPECKARTITDSDITDSSNDDNKRRNFEELDSVLGKKSSSFFERPLTLNGMISRKPINLVVLIHTAPANFKNRMNIRKTWGSVHYIKLQESYNPKPKNMAFEPEKTTHNGTGPNLNINSSHNSFKQHVLKAFFEAVDGQFQFVEMNVRLIFLTASMKLKNSVTQKQEMYKRPASPSPTNFNLFKRAGSTTPTSGFNFDIYHGTYQTNRVTEKLLRIEASKYRDIVQGDFMDSYQNLTYKMVMGFKWIASKCPEADYILKMDDDVLANPFPLYVTLNKIRALKHLFQHYSTYVVDKTAVKSQILDKSIDREPQPFLVDSDIPKLLKMISDSSKLNNSLKTKQDWMLRYAPTDLDFVMDAFKTFINLVNSQGYNGKEKLNDTADYYLAGDIGDSAGTKFTVFGLGSNSPYKLTCDSNSTKKHIDPANSCGALKSIYRTLDYNTNAFDNTLYCNIWIGMPVLRDADSKWYVSKAEIPENTYPPYCSGWAMLIPYTAAYKLMYAASTKPYFWIDDAHVTGTLVKAANLSLIRLNNRFTFGYFPTNAKNNINNSSSSFKDAESENDALVKLKKSLTHENLKISKGKIVTPPARLFSLQEFLNLSPTQKHMFGPVGDNFKDIKMLWERISDFYSRYFVAF